jgi:hypothetical protein
MNRLQKFNELSRPEKLLFLQTMLVLTSVTLGLRTVSWLKLQRLLLKLANWRARSAATQRVSPRSISRSIRAASHYVPKATCLPQALTAQHLLVWNRYPADFQIGVAKDADGKLEAHAWVTSQGKVIAGGERAINRFASLTALERQRVEDYGKLF